MDLIEITYHDYLAECAETLIGIDNWILIDWDSNEVLNCYPSFYNKKKQHCDKISITDTSFTLGDDHIELCDNVFETEPHTDIVPKIEGRLTTLAMFATIKIKDAKLKGKMCIRNDSKSPIYTEYEIRLKNSEMKMIIGMSILGDSLGYNHCIYKFPKVNLSFIYRHNSQMVSVFDKLSDTNKRNLLEQYILEYITRDLCLAIEDYQQESLCIKLLVSELCGNDYSLRNLLRIHNRKLHTAFNNLANRIISLSNLLITETCPKLSLPTIFGLSNQVNGDETLKVYKGFISNLNTLRMPKDKSVIVSKDNDLVILHVPVEFEKLILNCNKVIGNEVEETEGQLNQIHCFTTEGAHFILSLKKLDDNKVKFNLLDFRIVYFKTLAKSEINMTLDYLVSFAIEKSIKPCLEQALNSEELHELAVNPDVEIEYSDDDFEAEDSES